MKKMIKLSLAAAVAVSALSTTASAKALEEAIKDVDISGSLTYRYDDRTNSGTVAGVETEGTERTNNTYKGIVKLSSKVNDDLKANTTFFTRGVTNVADASPTLNLTHANFAYTGIANTTVIAGKQALNTPWTDGGDAINSAQSGTGILAMHTAGPVTVAAGYFNNNSIDGEGDDTVNIADNDIAVLALIGSVGPVNASIFYAKGGESGNTEISGAVLNPNGDIIPGNIETTTSALDDGFKAISVNVNGDIGPVHVDFRHSTLDVQDSTLSGAVAAGAVDTQKLTKIVASANLGAVGIAAGYGKTGTNGGLVAFDTDADANFSGWGLELNGSADAKAFFLSANANVTDKVNVAATYVDASGDVTDANWDADEWYVTTTYNMSSNFSAYVRYGEVSTDSNDLDTDAKQKRGRLQLAYTF